MIKYLRMMAMVSIFALSVGCQTDQSTSTSGATAMKALAATMTTVQTIPTRPGVTERFVLITPDHPVASLILFAGADGRLGISDKGDIDEGEKNFLVRTRSMWAGQGFQVAVVDVPSDGGKRDNYTYAQDMRFVAEFLKQKSNVPVWLVGTSRGTTSVVSIAVKFPNDNLVSGLVLTSSILSGEGSVTDFDLSLIKIPVLIVHNRGDRCPITPYALAPQLLDRLSSVTTKDLITIDGGNETRKQSQCKALSHHGYNGVEDVVVQKVSDWIKAHPVDNAKGGVTAVKY